ncbi:MAG: type II toxin-antitoxin system HicB family antitoxin [Gemmatimonadaceae bacterium]
MLSLLYEIEGYRARVERDRDGVLHGRVIEIDDVITFKAQTIRVVERNFARALEAYFERCRQLGKEPQAPGPTSF